MLLAGVGTLAKHGLMCERCDKNPQLKRSLGCLESPVVKIVHPSESPREEDWHTEEVVWTLDYFREYHESYGMDLDAEAAGNQYMFAPLGNITDYLPGEFWEFCPRSYSEFTSQGIRHAASEIIDAAMDIKTGIPTSWIFGGSQPTGKAKRLIRMCLRFLRDAENKREAGED